MKKSKSTRLNNIPNVEIHRLYHMYNTYCFLPRSCVFNDKHPF